MGQSVLPIPLGLRYNRTVITSTGTFTLPTNNINAFDCILISGGGGGGRPGTAINRYAKGGQGIFTYYQNVFCTAGTTLTVTVGAGGAGSTTLDTNGSNGTASTISGIVGNGTSTSLTSGAAYGGLRREGISANMMPTQAGQVLLGIYSSGGTANASFAVGPGAFSTQTNFSSDYYGASRSFLTGTTFLGSSGNRYFANGGGGAAMPLLGEYLHAAVGATGGSAVGSGGTSTANTFFAGNGGGASGSSNNGQPGLGGAGGAGGASTNTGNSGTGGNGSANSGGGGGAGGKNTNTANATGNGGNGGSGLIIIGYWA